LLISEIKFWCNSFGSFNNFMENLLIYNN